MLWLINACSKYNGIAVSFSSERSVPRIDRDEIPLLLKPMGIELKNKDDQRTGFAPEDGNKESETTYKVVN